MMKRKLWNPKTLHEVGGTEGVGLTFLEETFSGSTAPPEHRLHQKAAQAVLKALLPESGTDIKGQMRSRQELLAASGYADRPRDLDDLILILDPELRLITPTDPDGERMKDEGGRTPERMKDEGGRMKRENTSDDLSDSAFSLQPSASSADSSFILHPSSFDYYQLTHDYLVHSLRDWLSRKQRETRRGRAQLRLAERSASWNAQPENRHLPSLVEWANIRLLTRKQEWTGRERRLMKRAGQLYGARLVLTLALVAGAVLAGTAVRRQVIENQQATQAAGLVQRLLDADTTQVPEIVRAMRDYRGRVDPTLRKELENRPAGSRQKLHASLALLPVNATQVNYLLDRLTKATPTELPVLRDALRPNKTTVTAKLWTVLQSATPNDASLLPTASALASYDAHDAKWETVGDRLAQALVSVNPVYLGSWLDALRPVRGKLTASLAAIFQDKSRPETAHSLATNILADYASDDPDRLAELLMVSDHAAFRRLFPLTEMQAERVLPIFEGELAQRATYSWNDRAPDASWTKPDDDLVSRIEAAHGLLKEWHAFCQTMPLDEFLTAALALRKSGYRPVRFRPYADQQVVKVAAVWTRDGRNWRIAAGLSADEIRQQDERNQTDKFRPVDVAGYVAHNAAGKPADRYAALWVESTDKDAARMYVGMATALETEVQAQLTDEKLIPRTLHAMIGADGRTRNCGVWGQPPGMAVSGQIYENQFQRNLEQKLADLADQLLTDLVVSGAGEPRATRDRVLADLASADKKLKTKPDDGDARFSRALANLRLGENQKAVDDLQFVIARSPEHLPAKQYRIIALARLGKKQDARSELAQLQKEDAPESAKLYLAAVLAAELGEGIDKTIGALEAAIKKQPKDADARYDAARAFSLASRAVSHSDKMKGRQLAERSLQLLREAAKNDDADFGKMDEDGDLDPLRADSAFAEIMKLDHPDRRYAAVWNSDAVKFESIPLYGLESTAHLQKCRELIANGYRPVSFSIARTTATGPLVTASVWQRPTVQEDVKDRLAERQARAAIALVRMGNAEKVRSLLQHSPDPRLRSFIINWLSPFEADPKVVADELDRIDPAAATVADSPPTTHHSPLTNQRMDAILFHPETSVRRALILAMGTFGAAGLSPGEREPLVGKLLDLYRSDPDCGIHGAAEWTLRKWGQQDKLKEVDAQLMKRKEFHPRRWYVNSQGQTFAVIEGPVEFPMGSPPTDTERHPENEGPRRIMIPRSFAVATKEVTIEQFQRFLKEAKITIERYLLSPGYLSKFSPDAGGPWLGPDWFSAAHYCNWLSEQEGLPKDQWCYVPNEAGAYAEGMSIPADVLERTGYRLPTSAEWEYACRAGAATSRYYGHSPDLLDAYAWLRSNSDEHARSCGSLLANDLGLYDMLGNTCEWCQESANASELGMQGRRHDAVRMSESISRKYAPLFVRLLRGGSYASQPANVRSTDSGGNAASFRNAVNGFRPARTLP